MQEVRVDDKLKKVLGYRDKIRPFRHIWYVGRDIRLAMGTGKSFQVHYQCGVDFAHSYFCYWIPVFKFPLS